MEPEIAGTVMDGRPAPPTHQARFGRQAGDVAVLPMWKIIAAYMTVAGLCLAFLDTLGPAKDVIVVAAFIATAIGIWRYEPDRREVKGSP